MSQEIGAALFSGSPACSVREPGHSHEASTGILAQAIDEIWS
jgi:hypothetical protein